MNRSITILFLLFMLLVTGAFASMAQNNYGFTLIGAVALCFAVFFLYHLVRKLRGSGKPSPALLAELAALSVMALAAAADIFHLRVPFLPYLTMAAALVLAGVYLRSLFRHMREGKADVWTMLYYAGVVLFLLSFALKAFSSTWAIYAELPAFACLLAFVAGGMIWPMVRNGWSLDKVLELVGGFRDRSFLVASLFFFMAIYGFAVKAGALPPLYADTYPKVFFEMTGTAAESKGTGARTDMSPRLFKEGYDRFVSRNLEGER